MPRHILALDQGTTSSRAIVFDEAGRTVALAQHEFPQHFPQPGWVEHDAEEIWESQILAAREALAQSGLRAADLAAVGITNQRETTLIWDRATGMPIHRAVVWQSRQTAPICEGWRARGLTNLVTSMTGLVIDAYFSASKIRWLLDTVPGAQARAERGELAFGTVDSWLIWRLTGGAHLTDETNASRTMLYDIRHRRWSTELLEAFEVPAALLPEVLPSSADFGHTLPEVFGAPIPIRGVAGDQQAALFGQGCVRPGDTKNTYGTGCFLLANAGATAPTSEHGLLGTVAASTAGPAYALEGAVFVAGAAVQWLRDGLGLVATAEETAAVARSVPDTGGAYLVPAFAGLGAPYWDEGARGAVIGLTRGTERAHIVRATLEAIAYQSRDLVECIQADSGHPLTALRVDGGACRNDFLMQFQADILGIPVHRPKNLEVTALGAAGLAGIGAGVWDDATAFAAATSADLDVFEPQMAAAARAERYEGWRDAVARTRSQTSS
jgi:glycerol kinase